MRFAHPPSDELRVLSAKIEENNGFVGDRHERVLPEKWPEFYRQGLWV